MEPVLDNNCSRGIVRDAMEDPQKLTPQELFRIAADPPPALLALAGSAGAGAAMRNRGEKSGSAPKKRRKMSAAWEVMIALTEKARRGKGERIELQVRRERGLSCGRNLS